MGSADKGKILWHNIVSLKHSDGTKSGRACETEPPFTKSLQKAVAHRIAHKAATPARYTFWSMPRSRTSEKNKFQEVCQLADSVPIKSVFCVFPGEVICTQRVPIQLHSLQFIFVKKRHACSNFTSLSSNQTAFDKAAHGTVSNFSPV